MNEGDNTITNDEIKMVLKRGSGVEDGKYRIYSHFLRNKSNKERVQFLRDEYGMGGRSHAIPNVDRSYEDHDSKGIAITKGSLLEPSAKITLSWAEVAKRIDGLIEDGEYMTEAELGHLQSYERKMLGAGVVVFYEREPTDTLPIHISHSVHFWDDARQVGNLLRNADILSKLLLSMAEIMRETAPEHRSYDSRRETLNDLKAFERGEFTLFPKPQKSEQMSIFSVLSNSMV